MSQQRSLTDRIAALGMRVLMPGIGDRLRAEQECDAFQTTDALPETIYTVDRGAETTIFSFSSAGLLHAGLPTFAFEGLFKNQNYNLVFLRDIHRTAYHLTPAARAGGLAYYEAAIREAMHTLPGTRYIAIGESSGAAAALYFGTCCGMNQVVCFALPYPIQVWTSPGAVLHALFNLPELLRDPVGYKDVLLITFFSVISRFTLSYHVGAAGIIDPVATFKAATERPRLTLFHGARCRPDSQIAAMLATVPEVKIVSFPTGRHLLWKAIARQGSIGKLIMDELESLDTGS